jgi:YVTN family beta-propeller protein
MRFSKDGQLVFVALGTYEVAVVDAHSYEIRKYIPAGNRPERVEISADGSKLFVANNLGNNLTVIDVATLEPLGKVRVGRLPWGVAVAQ